MQSSSGASLFSSFFQSGFIWFSFYLARTRFITGESWQEENGGAGGGGVGGAIVVGPVQLHLSSIRHQQELAVRKIWS